MLIVGVGTRRGAPAEELLALADGLVGQAGARVGQVVTAERKRDEPAVVALAAHLGAPLHAYDEATLGAQRPARGSGTVSRLVGVPSVAEAAVLAAGGRVLDRARSATAVVVLGERVGDAEGPVGSA